jgi:arsenate reductase-like glutaredoxin family protein
MATQTLSDQKIELMVEISTLDKEELVQQVKNFVNYLKKRPTKKQLKMLEELSTTIGEKTDIEEIIREQNWKPIDRKEFDRLVKELDIQEPLEQLLADI